MPTSMFCIVSSDNGLHCSNEDLDWNQIHQQYPKCRNLDKHFIATAKLQSLELCPDDGANETALPRETEAETFMDGLEPNEGVLVQFESPNRHYQTYNLVVRISKSITCHDIIVEARRCLIGSYVETVGLLLSFFTLYVSTGIRSVSFKFLASGQETVTRKR